MRAELRTTTDSKRSTFSDRTFSVLPGLLLSLGILLVCFVPRETGIFDGVLPPLKNKGCQNAVGINRNHVILKDVVGKATAMG